MAKYSNKAVRNSQKEFNEIRREMDALLRSGDKKGANELRKELVRAQIEVSNSKKASGKERRSNKANKQYQLDIAFAG